MKLCPMIEVADVEKASTWYQQVIGLTSGHGGADYEMLFAGTPHQSPMLLQLHRQDTEEHGFSHGDGPVGAGVSLWVEVADLETLNVVVGRARAASTPVASEPAWNPLAHHHEAAMRDLDGYVVMVCTPFQHDGP